jgi:REP element-mobilizing transposase RayT
MHDPPTRHHPCSIRINNYDYNSEGGYFITLVTHARQSLFGEIVNDETRLNDIGRIVYEEWFRTAQMRPYVELFEDEIVVMPNHVHGIIWITDLVGAYCNTPLPPTSHNTPLPPDPGNTSEPGDTPLQTQTLRSPGFGIGAILRGYKSAVTKRVNELRATPYAAVWQRNYYEHNISTNREYESIAVYIDSNPRNWLFDDENPNTG